MLDNVILYEESIFAKVLRAQAYIAQYIKQRPIKVGTTALESVSSENISNYISSTEVYQFFYNS